MQLTRQADYAIRAVLYLAQLKPGQRIATAAIAREQKIPPTFLAKIIAQLSVAGIVQATRGAQGGVALARPANNLSLLEVVEVIEGPIVLNECVAEPQACGLSDRCPVQQVWCAAQAELVERLAAIKFDQLAAARAPDPTPSFN